jgi:transposase
VRARCWQRPRPRQVECPPPSRGGQSLDRIEWRRPRSTSAGRNCPWDCQDCWREEGSDGGRERGVSVVRGHRHRGRDLHRRLVRAGGGASAPITCDQTPQGYTTLQQRLGRTAVSPTATLVALEATGTYWVALAVALHEAGYRVAVVNPRQAHHFAKAQLRRAKTDALDARDLAQFAVALHPTPWAPPPAIHHEVRQRLVARDGLLAMRTQARNQRHALLQRPVVVAAVRRHLDELLADLNQSPGVTWCPGSRRRPAHFVAVKAVMPPDGRRGAARPAPGWPRWARIGSGAIPAPGHWGQPVRAPGAAGRHRSTRRRREARAAGAPRPG